MKIYLWPVKRTVTFVDFVIYLFVREGVAQALSPFLPVLSFDGE